MITYTIVIINKRKIIKNIACFVIIITAEIIIFAYIHLENNILFKRYEE